MSEQARQARRCFSIAGAAIVVAMLAAIGVLALPGAAQAEPRTQWEYRCLDAPAPDDLEPLLNQWGDNGWELAATFERKEARARLCFKRPRQGTAPMARAADPAPPASGFATDAEPPGHWQPTNEEFAAARAVLQPSLDRCGSDAREEGQAVLAITILGDGTVTATKAGQSALSSPTLRCAEEAARALRFRPFRAALISIDMPIELHGLGAHPASHGAPRAATASNKISD